MTTTNLSESPLEVAFLQALTEGPEGLFKPRDRDLVYNGFKVLRFTGAEVHGRLSQCLSELAGYLKTWPILPTWAWDRVVQLPLDHKLLQTCDEPDHEPWSEGYLASVSRTLLIGGSSKDDGRVLWHYLHALAFQRATPTWVIINDLELSHQTRLSESYKTSKEKHRLEELATLDVVMVSVLEGYRHMKDIERLVQLRHNLGKFTWVRVPSKMGHHLEGLWWEGHAEVIPGCRPLSLYAQAPADLDPRELATAVASLFS